MLGFLIAQDNLVRFVHSKDCQSKAKFDLQNKTWNQNNIQFTTNNLQTKEICALHTRAGGFPLFFDFGSSYSCEVRINFNLNTQIKLKNGELTNSVDIFTLFG